MKNTTKIVQHSNLYLFFPLVALSSLNYALAAPASEQTPTDQQAQEPLELQTVTVRPDYLEIESLGNTKQVVTISKDEISEKGYRTVSDILSKVSFISVAATGQGEIDIRGQGSDEAARNLQVLVDGSPITTLVNHPQRTNYDVIPVEQIERIDIIPGGGSVLYGSGASGGIINITTNLKNIKNQSSSVSAEINSKGSRLNADLSKKLSDTLTVKVTAAQIKRDLHFVDTFRNSKYASAAINWDISDKHNVSLRLSHLEEDSVYINTVNIEKLKEKGRDYKPKFINRTIGLNPDGTKIKKKIRGYLYGDRVQDRLGLAYNYDFSDNLTFSSNAFVQKGYYKGNDNSERQMDTKTHGIRSKVKWKYSDNGSLLIGVDAISQQGTLKYDEYKYNKYVKGVGSTYKKLPFKFDYNKQSTALFVSNNIKWGKWESTQGIRKELTKWSFDKPLYGKYGNTSKKVLQQFEHSKDFWNTALELGVAYNYSDTGHVFGRYERGYTLPDGIEITDDYKVNKIKYIKATDAKPKTFDMFELGWKDSFALTTVDITAWYSQTDNHISRLYKKDYTKESINALKTQRMGIDISLSQQFGNLTLEESYSYLKGKTDYANNEVKEYIKNNKFNGKTRNYLESGLKKVPRNKVSVRATYDFNDKTSVSAQYTYQGKYENTIAESEQENKGNDQVKGFGLLDISANYQPTDWLQVYGGVTNVLDKEYYEYSEGNGIAPSVVPGAERSYFLGLKASF